MRDPKRIDRMLEILRKYWLANPDLRLGQIVSNMTGSHPSVFYIEDHDMEHAIRNAVDFKV